MLKSAKSAFTLVELLVVIAIISVLAALLLPTLENARTSAVTITCVSNLKQYANAGFIYAQNYENVWPGLAQGNKFYLTPEFRDLIGAGPISGTSGAYFNVTSLCAASRSAQTLGRIVAGQIMAPVTYTYGSAFRYTILEADGKVRPPGVIMLDKLLRPSDSVAFADALDHMIYNYDPFHSTRGYFMVDETLTGKGILAFRHQQSFNACFYDGHAATLNWDGIKGKNAVGVSPNPGTYYFEGFYK